MITRLGVTAVAATSAVLTMAPAAEAAPEATTPSWAVPSVAAVFASPTASGHSCSGVVVDDPSGSLVLTAAHCVAGRGTSLRVVPGYDGGRRPYGTWAVTAAFVDPGWQAGADPTKDLAVLKVAPVTVNGSTRTLGSYVGGYRLGQAPAAGEILHGYGYLQGSGDRVLGCTSRATTTAGYPTFDCAGMSDGVSGAPLATAAADGTKTIRGVIGGLHEGGCSPDVSYSSPFGAWSDALVRRASRSSVGDVVGPSRGDGC